MLINCCQICHSETGDFHVVREMMLGTRDPFVYFECSECGCLSLATIPEDLEKYYPQDYCEVKTRRPSLIRKLLNALYLSPFSSFVSWRQRKDLDVIRRLKLKKNMTLLEVGGSSGSLLGDLRDLGYIARGVSRFVPSDVCDRYGVRVERKDLAAVKGKFDVILFRHSLEHLPVEMLKIARKHLKSNGFCVVCIPLVGWAWQHYETDWAALDAPRHLFVHSSKSFSLLAAQSNFKIEKIVFDSTEAELWASDSYQRGVPLKSASQPTRVQRNRLREFAESLNLRGSGDTAQFYLRPS